MQSWTIKTVLGIISGYAGYGRAESRLQQPRVFWLTSPGVNWEDSREDRLLQQRLLGVQNFPYGILSTKNEATRRCHFFASRQTF